VVIFICFPIGLVIYLIARGVRTSDEENKYSNKLCYLFLLVIPITIFLFIGTRFMNAASQEEGFYLRSGQFFGMRHNVSEQNWDISATRASGRMERNFYLTQDDLDNLYTFLRIHEGEVILRLR